MHIKITFLIGNLQIRSPSIWISSDAPTVMVDAHGVTFTKSYKNTNLSLLAAENVCLHRRALKGNTEGNTNESPRLMPRIGNE